MPCTTILVGKKASYNGSTLMARNEDSQSFHYTPKKFVVVMPDKQPRKYKSVLTKFQIDLPNNPLRYTAMPNALPDEGVWGEAGFNELNVSMSETETITSNSRVLGADPLVKDGIGEEDMFTVVLPYIKSAKEGVIRLGNIIKEYGTCEMNGIGFQDENEIWWFESIGGHHYIAKRVPDDCYVVMPNQLGIDSFDLVDAFGKKENHMCSDDLIEFIKNNNLDLTMEDHVLEEETDLDTRAIFGSKSDSDHVYNTARAWFMLRYLNPSESFDGPMAMFKPEDDYLPWSMVPEHKVTIEDIKYVLSSYYQGTPFNPYDNNRPPHLKPKYRPIGINRNNFLAITEIRPNVPEEIKAVEWIAEGSNAFNTVIPFYANITKTPAYLAKTTSLVTTESFYWVNRIIGALTDAHYHECMAEVERYQQKTVAIARKMLSDFDKEYILNKKENVHKYLEECNEKIAEFAKEETYKLLDKVLYESSNHMKNGFSKSDY